MIRGIKIGFLSFALLIVFGASQVLAKDYIVGFKSQPVFQQLSKNYQVDKNEADFSVKNEVQFMNSNSKVTHLFSNLQMLMIKADDEKIISALKKNPAISFIVEDEIIPAPRKLSSAAAIPMASGEEATVQYPWGVLAIDAPGAWAFSNGGEGARVMVLDTGIDVSHPALASRFEKGANFADLDAGVTVPYDYFDTQGHGTHVAGTILADGVTTGLVGVAPRAKLLAARVCASRGCAASWSLKALEWAVQEKVQVVNMSLGGSFSHPSIAKAYEQVQQYNVLVVAASGNGGTASVAFPAGYPATLAVGAIDESGTRAAFSQYGPALDIVAPGVNVLSSVPKGTGRTAQLSIEVGTQKQQVTVMGATGSAMGVVQSTPLVYVGLAKPTDLQGVDLTGKVALIQRGEISFAEKAQNVLAVGAIGAIIFNNVPGLFGATLDPAAPFPVLTMDMNTGTQVVQLLQASNPVKVSMLVQATDYASNQGTSMASPHVAGVAALVRVANPNLTAAQAKQVILNSAMAPTADNKNNEYGKGIVNALAAVQAAMSVPATPSVSVLPAKLVDYKIAN